MNIRAATHKYAVVIGISAGALTCPLGVASAQQFDAEYVVREKQFGEQWAAEESQVQGKLAALEKKFGKKPNIVFILGDDIGYTELGSYGGGKVRGAPTPRLDKMADEGMRFLSFYSEPSCTPTRAALMTGRHPVRIGMLGVLFPGTSGMGLVDEEVTVAELLSDAGYHTGMFGKWHLGDDEGMTPIEQGFDEAVWSEGNPPWWSFHQGGKGSDNAGYVNIGALVWAPGPGNFPYDTGGIMKGVKGEEPEMVAPFSLELYNTMDTDVADDVIDFINRHAKSTKPFFAYYAGKANHFWGAHPDFMNQPAGTNNSAQMAEHDHNVGRVLDRLNELGIAENTLVVWMSDNGPMYDIFPESSSSAFTGGKGDVLEGGVHVPAIAWWPGIIDSNQINAGLLQVTDMYTTAARIGGAIDKIPNDRVIDGLEQSSYLMAGTRSRREYIFHYSGKNVGAIRVGQYKRHMVAAHGGLPGKAFHDIYKDPKEEHGVMAELLWAWVPFDDVLRMHNELIEKYPHRKPYYSTTN